MTEVKQFIHKLKIQLEKKGTWEKRILFDLINLVYLEMLEEELDKRKD